MVIPIPYEEHDPPRLTRGVRVLLAISVAMLFLQRTVVSDADAFAVLGFQGRSVWSAVTYMFVHFSVWHLVLNMSALLVFGPRLEGAMGTRAFTFYFFWCGLGGAVFHLLFVRSGLLLGSSAAVFGVMFAYWQQWPRDEIALFGAIPMRAWVVALVLLSANLAAGILGPSDPSSGANGWIYLAHVGGIAFGWLYFRTPPAASLDRLRQRISPAPDYQDEAPPRAIPRTLPRARTQRDEVDEIVAKSKAVASQKRPATRVVTTVPHTREDASIAELDRLLDKISLTGLQSLTVDERNVLDESVRRLRGEG
ncbi:MAG: rhomboid family intramembrane serine protease [Gemmatimonadota bacterium]|nr:rhomboid family intramembrane serine protease [Gemmatimonadota bacterium]